MTRQGFFASLCIDQTSSFPMSNTPDPAKVFSEKLNGRVAMLGLAIGLATEWITGQGIIQQVFGIFG